MIICGATKNFVSYTILWLHSKIFHGFEIFSFCEFFITISNYWNHVILRIIRYKVKVRALRNWLHSCISYESYDMTHMDYILRPYEKALWFSHSKKTNFFLCYFRSAMSLLAMIKILEFLSLASRTSCKEKNQSLYNLVDWIRSSNHF